MSKEDVLREPRWAGSGLTSGRIDMVPAQIAAAARPRRTSAILNDTLATENSTIGGDSQFPPLCDFLNRMMKYLEEAPEGYFNTMVSTYPGVKR